MSPGPPVFSASIWSLNSAARNRKRGCGCCAARLGPASPPESVEIAAGDITSPNDVSRAAEGVAEVYHLAGIVQREPKDPGLLYKTHVEGTRNVCEAVKRHSVSKAVFVSTSGTMAVGRTPVERDETAGYAIETVGAWPYYTSKIYAEKLALQYVDDEKLPIVIVNPSLLLGPGDDRLSSTGDVALFLEGQSHGDSQRRAEYCGCP